MDLLLGSMGRRNCIFLDLPLPVLDSTLDIFSSTLLTQTSTDTRTKSGPANMESARNAINNLMGNTENASCAPFLTDSQSLTYNSLQETLPTLERTPPGLKRMFPTLETMFPGPVQMILGWQKDSMFHLLTRFPFQVLTILSGLLTK